MSMTDIVLTWWTAFAGAVAFGVLVAEIFEDERNHGLPVRAKTRAGGGQTMHHPGTEGDTLDH